MSVTSPTPAPTTTGPAVADLELAWLEDLIDARLHTARRNDDVRRILARAATLLSATGLGFWIGVWVR